MNIMKIISSIAKAVSSIDPKNFGNENSCITISPTVSTIPVSIAAAVESPESSVLEGDVIMCDKSVNTRLYIICGTVAYAVTINTSLSLPLPSIRTHTAQFATENKITSPAVFTSCRAALDVSGLNELKRKSLNISEITAVI